MTSPVDNALLFVDARGQDLETPRDNGALANDGLPARVGVTVNTTPRGDPARGSLRGRGNDIVFQESAGFKSDLGTVCAALLDADELGVDLAKRLDETMLTAEVMHDDWLELCGV